MVEEAVELGLGKRLELNGNIVTQLEEGFEAAVRDELRGIETAAEQAPAVAAHFGHQQRSHGVLSIGGDQRRERRKRQRLQPRHRQLHLAEIDPAVDARRKVSSVLGGAASAESAFTRTRMPRMRSCVLGGSSGRSKNMPRSLLQNHNPLTLRLRSRARMTG